MDLNTITEVARPIGNLKALQWRDGDAWLAGGTWLFSEPQPHLRRLIDLQGLGWAPLVTSAAGPRDCRHLSDCQAGCPDCAD